MKEAIKLLVKKFRKKKKKKQKEKLKLINFSVSYKNLKEKMHVNRKTLSRLFGSTKNLKKI